MLLSLIRAYQHSYTTDIWCSPWSGIKWMCWLLSSFAEIRETLPHTYTHAQLSLAVSGTPEFSRDCSSDGAQALLWKDCSHVQMHVGTAQEGHAAVVCVVSLWECCRTESRSADLAGLSLLPQDPSFALVVITIPTAPVLQKMQLKGVLVGQEQFAEWIRRAIISLQPGTQACFFFVFFFEWTKGTECRCHFLSPHSCVHYSCEATDCQKLEIDNALLNCTGGGWYNGAQCNVSCRTGYILQVQRDDDLSKSQVCAAGFVWPTKDGWANGCGEVEK